MESDFIAHESNRFSRKFYHYSMYEFKGAQDFKRHLKREKKMWTHLTFGILKLNWMHLDICKIFTFGVAGKFS